jgi:WhiB family redox-sensing transcriptional regulator
MTQDWRTRAACLGMDTELWFPEGIEALAQQAKAVCARCPVRDDCLEFALAAGEVDGIWGGLDEDERRALRRIDALVLAGSS